MLRQAVNKLKVLQSKRCFSLTPTSCKWKLKWATGRDALGPDLPVGMRYGNPQDPVFNTFDLQRPPYGDPEYKKFYYREMPRTKSYLDKLMHTLCATIFWYWMFYHFYWYPGLVIGEHYLPYPYEFTDAELGIPPDDAPDPTPDQYWGNHGKDPKNYR